MNRAPELKTRKNDLIVWVYLSKLQLKLYQGFVNSERVKEVKFFFLFSIMHALIIFALKIKTVLRYFIFIDLHIVQFDINHIYERNMFLSVLTCFSII